MMPTTRLIILCCLISHWACEEKTDWPLDITDTDIPVISGIITDQYKHQRITLSLSHGQPAPTPIGVSDADVQVTDGQQVFKFLEDPLHPGTYVSEIPFKATNEKTYQLRLHYNEQTYQATDKMTPITPIDSITFKMSDSTGRLSIATFVADYRPDENSMTRVEIDWSHISDDELTRALLFYYTFNTIDIPQILKPPNARVYFPRGSRLIINKYSLSDAFASYLRATLLETQWQGGAFDDASYTPQGNISHGALGFFGVSATLSDTLIAP